MKQIFKILSIILCITLFLWISSCAESTPSLNQYTVTFKDYDGTILREEVVQEGHNATAPSDPIRDGYLFIGWGEEYTNVKKNTICIAQYEKQNEIIVDKYTVTFDSNGGTIIESQQVEKGNNVIELIKWRVLEESDGTYKLLSEMIIDNRDFYHTIDQNRIINGETIYPNNYEYSNIRAWLNGYDGSSYDVDNYTGTGFYDIAFTEEEKQLINTTLVDNGLVSTSNSTNDYICNTTSDKGYLLSLSDTKNQNYGFISGEYENDNAKFAKVVDYARSKFCSVYTKTDYIGNGYWWFRTPYRLSENAVHLADASGVSYTYVSVKSKSMGVRPAITITIE